MFGPLLDGCIVDASVLPGLVRATAINANNALRSFKMGYLPLYPLRKLLASNEILNLAFCVFGDVLSVLVCGSVVTPLVLSSIIIIIIFNFYRPF